MRKTGSNNNNSNNNNNVGTHSSQKVLGKNMLYLGKGKSKSSVNFPKPINLPSLKAENELLHNTTENLSSTTINSSSTGWGNPRQRIERTEDDLLQQNEEIKPQYPWAISSTNQISNETNNKSNTKFLREEEFPSLGQQIPVKPSPQQNLSQPLNTPQQYNPPHEFHRTDTVPNYSRYNNKNYEDSNLQRPHYYKQSDRYNPLEQRRPYEDYRNTREEVRNVREDYRNIREDYKNNMEERFPPRKPYERHDSLNNNNMPIRIQSRNSDEPRGLKLNPPRNNFESREKTVYKTNNNNKDGAVLSDWANSCDDEQMDFNQPLIFADSKFEEEKQRKEKLKREEELKRQEEFERKKNEKRN